MKRYKYSARILKVFRSSSKTSNLCLTIPVDLVREFGFSIDDYFTCKSNGRRIVYERVVYPKRKV